MLKISQTGLNGQPRIFQLEGQIMGPWVDELSSICEGILNDGKNIILDFSHVSFLDAKGISLLIALLKRHVRVRNCSPFVAEQLKGITQCRTNELDAGGQHA